MVHARSSDIHVVIVKTCEWNIVIHFYLHIRIHDEKGILLVSMSMAILRHFIFEVGALSRENLYSILLAGLCMRYQTDPMCFKYLSLMQKNSAC